jgi:hypothetical protein
MLPLKYQNAPHHSLPVFLHVSCQNAVLSVGPLILCIGVLIEIENPILQKCTLNCSSTSSRCIAILPNNGPIIRMEQRRQISLELSYKHQHAQRLLITSTSSVPLLVFVRHRPRKTVECELSNLKILFSLDRPFCILFTTRPLT